MYCKFCGKQIDDDSVFCVHCGKNLAGSNKPSPDEQNNEPDKQLKNEPTEVDKGFPLWGLWFFFLPVVVAIILFVVYAGSSSPDASVTLSKDLKSSDYTYTTAQDLTSFRITITPKCDINNCDVELTLYSAKGETLFADTISKTNLKQGNSYTYTFNFGFVNSLSGSKVKFDITGKRK